MTRSQPLIAILNGPNLNLLGQRDSKQYGVQTLDDIQRLLEQEASQCGVTLRFFQSNSEGALVDAVHQALKECDGLIINPGAYTHTSIALRDALECFQKPSVEVHLSNIFKREEFRRQSYISEVVTGVISGLGAQGYILALRAVVSGMAK